MVIQQYQNPRVGKYLQYGYWYQEHRPRLLRAARVGLLVLVIIIWAVLAYFAYGFILSQAQYNQVLEDLTRERVNVVELQQARAPAEIEVSAVAVLPGETQTRADFISFADNPNSNWSVEVDYNFVWDGGQTTTETSLVLPQSKTVLTSRGVTVNNLPTAADLQILGKRWHRVRERAEAERVAAVKSGIVIESPVSERVDGSASATFTVKNQSIYNWLTPRFVVVLSQAGTPLAIGVNEIPELASGAEENLEYRWRQLLPAGLAVEVYPILNPFDLSSYRLPAGGDYAL